MNDVLIKIVDRVEVLLKYIPFVFLLLTTFMSSAIIYYYNIGNIAQIIAISTGVLIACFIVYWVVIGLKNICLFLICRSRIFSKRYWKRLSDGEKEILMSMYGSKSAMHLNLGDINVQMLYLRGLIYRPLPYVSMSLDSSYLLKPWVILMVKRNNKNNKRNNKTFWWF